MARSSQKLARASVTDTLGGWAGSRSPAVLAAATIALPGWGKFAGLGLGMFATGLGAFRQDRRASQRLAGAGATALGMIAVALSATKVGLTLAAASALERLVS